MTSVREKYASPGHPVAFAGLGRIVNRYKNRATPQSIKSQLEASRGYTLHRKRKRIKSYNPFFADTKREQVQMDLIDISALWRWNGGVRFICVAIDTFTKKAAAVGQKNKSALSTLASVRQILENDLAPPPKTIIFDEGKEFNNQHLSKYLKNLSVKTENPRGTHKAAVAERFNRTLQDLVYQYLTEHKTKRYIDQLPLLLQTYNNRHHRTIKMTPNQAELGHNQSLVREQINLRIGKLLTKKEKPSLKIGDHVRLKVKRFPFTRGYHKTFSDELYLITKILNYLPVVMYSVKRADTHQPVRGAYYEKELQRYIV